MRRLQINQNLNRFYSLENIVIETDNLIANFILANI